ncbi:MAG: MBL fold metallo-hydrolase, partial [Myxococcota bacterium]
NGADGVDGVDGIDGADGADGEDATVDPLLSPIDKAFTGIGGQAAIEAMTGFALATAGTTGIGYEAYAPDQLWSGVTTFTETVSGDVAGDAWRVDVVRDNWFFGVPVPQTFSEVLSGDQGEVQGLDSILGFPSVVSSDRWAAIRRNQRLLNPHLILAAVAADPSLATDGGVQLLDGSVHDLVVVADPVAPITLWVNDVTGRIDKLTTLENDPTFSDVEVEVFYSGWTASDGALLFPSRVFVAVDGQLVRDETRTAPAAIDPAFGADTFTVTTSPPAFDPDLAARGEQESQFHQVFSGVGIPLSGLADAVTPAELSPGVWHLTTASHHAMLVEQQDGLVLFDAPLYPVLADAILAWAASTYPNKPITHVVVSHHHRDHVGGLRSLVAAGATVVVHEDLVDYYEDLFTRPRTVQPDTLAEHPVAAAFEVVPDHGSVTLGSAIHPVTVFSVASSHAGDLVVPIVTDTGTAFSVDVYSPGFGVNAFGLELHTALLATGVPVTTLAGGHGFGTQTWAGFEAELVDAGLL